MRSPTNIYFARGATSKAALWGAVRLLRRAAQTVASARIAAAAEAT